MCNPANGIPAGGDPAEPDPAPAAQGPPQAAPEQTGGQHQKSATMKKMLIVLAGMLLLSPAAVMATSVAFTSAPTGVWVKLEINLHRPKFNCERGFGICFLVSAGFNNENSGTPHESLLPARARVNERDQLTVEIAETALTRYDGGAALPFFRNRNTVSIQDPYEIPESTCRTLGLKSPRFIKPGTCPVSYKSGVYTVVFQL